MQKNFITWILLVVLTLGSFFSSGNAFGDISLLMLMAIVVIKCALVGFQFMELGKAHIIWRVMFLSLIGLFTTIIITIVWT